MSNVKTIYRVKTTSTKKLVFYTLPSRQQAEFIDHIWGRLSDNTKCRLQEMFPEGYSGPDLVNFLYDIGEVTRAE